MTPIVTLPEITRAIWEGVKFVWAAGAAVATIIIVAVAVRIAIDDIAKWIRKKVCRKEKTQ